VSFAKVFKLGDWVKIGDVEGKVVEMTPRSTKVLTANASIINIPNSTVSGAIIENYTHPNKAFKQVIRLEIVPLYRFEFVEKILLDAVSSTDGILKNPAPAIAFLGQGDSSQKSTWRRIWRHLEQADIILATPQREVFLPKEVEAPAISAPRTVIENCGAFTHLSEEEKEELATKLIAKEYLSGEVIVDNSTNNDRLFIIIEGVVSIRAKEDSQEERLGVAEIFKSNVYSATFLKIKYLSPKITTLSMERAY